MRMDDNDEDENLELTQAHHSNTLFGKTHIPTSI